MVTQGSDRSLRARTRELWFQFQIRHLARFAFVHINKTGGSSIERALGVQKKHLTAVEYMALVGEARWSELFTFAVVRNPWDRAVSHYHHRIRTDQTGMAVNTPSFKDWLHLTLVEQDATYFDDPKFFAPQSDWVVDGSGQVAVDFLCRLETIEADFAMVCRRIGVAASLPHLNRSDVRKPYQDMYDQSSKEWVRQWFARDIELFDYSY